jgi:hypothetical protein
MRERERERERLQPVSDVVRQLHHVERKIPINLSPSSLLLIFYSWQAEKLLAISRCTIENDNNKY